MHAVVVLMLLLLAVRLDPCCAGSPRFHHSSRMRQERRQADRGAGAPATQLRLHGGMRGCLQAASASDGRIQLHPCHKNSADQWWALQPQFDDVNAVVLRLENSASCITADAADGDDSAAPSKALHLGPCMSSTAQRFNVFHAAFVERGSLAKGFVLQSVPFPHLCLDGNMRATLSTALRLAPCEDSAFQLFHGDMLALLAQPAEARHSKKALNSADKQHHQRQSKQRLDDRMDKMAEKLRKHVAQGRPASAPDAGRNSFATHSRSQHPGLSNRMKRTVPSKKEVAVRLFSKAEWEGRVTEIHCCSIQRLRQPVLSLLVRPGYHVVLYGDWRCHSVAADLFGPTNNITAFLPSLPQQVHCIQALPVQPSMHIPNKDTPSSVRLFQQEHFQGQAIHLPTIQAPNLYQSPLAALFDFDELGPESDGRRFVSSLRVPAGARVFLHFGNRQGDGRLFVRDTAMGLQRAFTHISATWMPWQQLRGAVLCPRPQYEGHCQYFTLGFHDVPRDGMASIYLAREGYRVKLLDTNSRTIVPIGTNVTDTSRVFELDQREPVSFLVQHACKDECSKHGRCVGPNTCRCHKGWNGDHCRYGPPDFTSTIVCESNTVIVGMALRCVFRPRHEGLPTMARQTDVRIQPVPDMQEHVFIAFDASHMHSNGDGSESSAVPAGMAPALHFLVTSNHSTPQHVHLFSASIISPPATATATPEGSRDDTGDDGFETGVQLVHTPRIFAAPRWRKGDVHIKCDAPVQSLLHGSERYLCQLTSCSSPQEQPGEPPADNVHWQKKTHTTGKRHGTSAGARADRQRRARSGDTHTGGRDRPDGDTCDANCVPTAVEKIACHIEHPNGSAPHRRSPYVHLHAARTCVENECHDSSTQQVTACSFAFALDIPSHGAGNNCTDSSGTCNMLVHGHTQEAAGGARRALRLRCGYTSTAAMEEGPQQTNRDDTSSSSSSSSDQSKASRVAFSDVLLDISLKSLVQERAAHVLDARISEQLSTIHWHLHDYRFSSALALTRHLLRDLQRSPLGSLVGNKPREGMLSDETSDAVGTRAVSMVRQLRLTLEVLQLQVLQLTGRFDDMVHACKKLKEAALSWGVFGGEHVQHKIDALERTAREMKIIESGLVQHTESNACGQQAMDALNAILTVARGNSRYRRWRAECFILHGNASAALADVTSLGRLEPTAAYPLRLMGSVHWRLLGSTRTAGRLLHSCQRRASPGDGELQRCREEAKVMRRVSILSTSIQQLKADKEWQRAIAAIKELLGLDDKSDMALVAMKELCELHFFVNEIDNALYSCTRALDDIRLQEDDQFVVHLLMYRAWSYLAKEVFSNALRDVKRARRIAPHDMRLMLLQRRIEAAVKEATTKDYYSILGVPKGADKGMIRKAYRRLVRVWHPDKNNHPDAEQKFLDIVEAYEVLMDDELRQAYDKGLDLTEYMERRKRTQQQKDTASGGGGGGGNTEQEATSSSSSFDDHNAGEAEEGTGEDDAGETDRRGSRGARKQRGERQTHINLPEHCCITFLKDTRKDRQRGY